MIKILWKTIPLSFKPLQKSLLLSLPHASHALISLSVLVKNVFLFSPAGLCSVSPVSTAQCVTQQPQASLAAVHSTNGAQREEEESTGRNRRLRYLSGGAKGRRINIGAPWARQHSGHTAGGVCLLSFFCSGVKCSCLTQSSRQCSSAGKPNNY